MKQWLLLMLATTAVAGPLDETRYCGPPKRDASGQIVRSSAVIRAFRAVHPCPSTGLKTGPCAGFAIDHVIPLASCGCDAVANLQWLPNAIKSAPGALAKDRWERWVYTCPK